MSWYIEIQDQQRGQQIKQKMVSLMKVQFSFFGALIELTPSGDHEIVTGLVNTQICGIHVGCYTKENTPVLIYTAYESANCTNILLKKLWKAILIAFPFLFVSHTVVSCTACDMWNLCNSRFVSFSKPPKTLVLIHVWTFLELESL